MFYTHRKKNYYFLQAYNSQDANFTLLPAGLRAFLKTLSNFMIGAAVVGLLLLAVLYLQGKEVTFPALLTSCAALVYVAILPFTGRMVPDDEYFSEKDKSFKLLFENKDFQRMFRNRELNSLLTSRYADIDNPVARHSTMVMQNLCSQYFYSCKKLSEYASQGDSFSHFAILRKSEQLVKDLESEARRYEQKRQFA